MAAVKLVTEHSPTETAIVDVDESWGASFMVDITVIGYSPIMVAKVGLQVIVEPIKVIKAFAG